MRVTLTLPWRRESHFLGAAKPRLCALALLVAGGTTAKGLNGRGSHEAWSLFPESRVPGERPGAFGPEVRSFGPGGDLDENIFSVSSPSVEPFVVPPGRTGRTDAAVLVVPGGGYQTVSFGREGTDIAEWLNSIGISAFVLKYRVPMRPWMSFGEPQLIDAQRAMGLIRSRAQRLALNASQIGVMGFSAGAHVAGYLVTASATRAYRRIDAVDNVDCRPNFALFLYPWALVDDDSASKLTFNITGEHPPSFFAQAEDDGANVENSLLYYLGLRSARAASSELHIYPHGGHGYGLCNIKTADGRICTWTKEIPTGCTWVAWSEMCTWPDRAARFLRSLGIESQTRTDSQISKVLSHSGYETLFL